MISFLFVAHKNTMNFAAVVYLPQELPTKMSEDAYGNCASTAETTAASSQVPNRSGAALEDSLFSLGRRTESLLRNMRFDNVVLQSRDEDMRNVLSKLEDELRSLEKMMGGPASPVKIHEGGEQEEASDRIKRLSSVTSESSHSSVDWAEVPTITASIGDVSQQKKKKSNEACPLGNKNELDFGDDSDSAHGLESVVLSAIAETTKNEQDTPIRGLFNWGIRADRRRLSSSVSSTGVETKSATSAPSWFRRDIRRQIQTHQKECDEASVLTDAHSVSSAPLLQLFGGGKKPERSQSERRLTVNDVTLFQKMFLRNTFSGAMEDNIPVIDEAAEGELPESPVNSDVNEVQKEKPTVAEVLSTLDIKLRGCDLSRASLQELHTLQARTLLDLQRDHNHSQIDYEVESLYIESQLKELRTKFAYSQREHKRKQRLLKEAMAKTKKASDREELLMEEVECVRTELFALNRELSKNDVPNTVATKGDA